MVVMHKTIYIRGIATIELLIALAVGVIMISGATMLSLGGQTAGLDTELAEHGLYKTSSVTEVTMGEVAGLWNGAAGVVTAFGADFYNPASKIADISPCLKLVSGSTSHDDYDKGRDFGQGLESLVASVAQARALGGGCDPFPPEVWDTPRVFGSTPPNVIDGEGTGIDVASIGGKKYAFVTSNNSSGSKSDFWVIDITDSDDPLLVASIEAGGCRTVPSEPKSCGLNSVDVGDGYAYVTNMLSTKDTSSEELIVIDVGTDPLDPRIVKKVTLGITPNCPGAYCPGGAQIARYQNHRVFVGTHRIGGAEFHAFDVTDPTNPSPQGSLNLEHNINDISINGNYAFLATSNNSGEVMVMNISGAVPTNTGIVFGADGNEDGEAIYVLGDQLYLGRDRTPAARSDFYILDVSKLLASAPPNEVIISSKNLSLGASAEGVTALTVQGTYAFLGISGSSDPFHVWDVSVPSSPWRTNTCPAPPLPQNITGLVYSNDKVLVAFRSNEAFRILYDDPSISCPQS